MTDPKRFDLIAAIQGRTYPKEDVLVFLDEALAYEYSKAILDHDHDPNNAEKAARRDAIQAELESAALTVTVQGLPPERHEAIRKEAFEKFPMKRNAFGQEEVDRRAAEFVGRQTWMESIVLIATSDGQSMVPSPEELEALEKMAPEASVNAIHMAIVRLQEGAARGYINAVQEHSFLSQPSAEDH